MNLKPTIIGVSGVAGGGKTTLTNALARHYGAATLYFDDYANDETYPADLPQWLADGADFNAFRAPQLAADLAALKQGQSIQSVVEGSTIAPTPFVFCEAPLGRAHHATGQYFDYLIYINTPLEIGLARFVLRFVAGKGQVSAAALEQFLQNYLLAFRPIYLEQIRQVVPGCDLVLNGEETVEAWVTAVQKAITESPDA